MHHKDKIDSFVDMRRVFIGEQNDRVQQNFDKSRISLERVVDLEHWTKLIFPAKTSMDIINIKIAHSENSIASSEWGEANPKNHWPRKATICNWAGRYLKSCLIISTVKIRNENKTLRVQKSTMSARNAQSKQEKDIDKEKSWVQLWHTP